MDKRTKELVKHALSSKTLPKWVKELIRELNKESNTTIKGSNREDIDPMAAVALNCN